MTAEDVPSAPGAPAGEQLRLLHAVYGAGTVLWTVSLFAAVLGHDAGVRQVLVLLVLLAVFGLMWLWSAWRLWLGGTAQPVRRPRL
ncbi:hypothetical protein [Streptomyces sp. NPDC004065]|uniref:hypothetical protein n=1 Tax=Streptomyces sp. NPDC004065 TaxID=3364689 RepID=UPI00384B532B